MEKEDAGVDAERVPAQHFHIPVLEAGGVMGSPVGSIGDSSSEVSVIGKSERLAMFMDGDWVAGAGAWGSEIRCPH